jgi:hypothetical protein
VPSGSTSTRLPSERRLALIVFSLLIVVGPSRGDDANPFSALGVDDCYKQALDHPSRKKPFLAVRLAYILFDQGEGIIEDVAGRLETDPVATKVDRGLVLISFKIIAFHESNGCQ